MKLLYLFLVFIAGCSTVPQIAPVYETPSVVIIRDTGFRGSGCKFEVIIDKTVVGILDDKILKFDVSPGEHKVTIRNITPICNNIVMTQSVNVSNKSVPLRMGYGANHQVFFEPAE